MFHTESKNCYGKLKSFIDGKSIVKALKLMKSKKKRTYLNKKLSLISGNKYSISYLLNKIQENELFDLVYYEELNPSISYQYKVSIVPNRIIEFITLNSVLDQKLRYISNNTYASTKAQTTLIDSLTDVCNVTIEILDAHAKHRNSLFT
jgi:hypothetical protein